MIRSAHSHAMRRPGRHMGAADPISAGVGVAVAGAQMWLQSINQSHAQMAGTTEIVNGWATQMGNLTRAYLSTPNPTCADQRAALDAFDQSWMWLQSTAACGNGAYGAAGLACISDRAPGGKFDATRANRDPIANDPRVSGCDTSPQLLLPSLTTGTYGPADITSSGQSDLTPESTVQSSMSVPGQMVPGTLIAGIPNALLFAGIGLLGFLFLRPSR